MMLTQFYLLSKLFCSFMYQSIHYYELVYYIIVCLVTRVAASSALLVMIYSYLPSTTIWWNDPNQMQLWWHMDRSIWHEFNYKFYLYILSFFTKCFIKIFFVNLNWNPQFFRIARLELTVKVKIAVSLYLNLKLNADLRNYCK